MNDTIKIRGLMVGATLAAILVASAAPARAQGAVGSGPLTQALTETEPQSNVMSIGRIKVAPGITVREIGKDKNVFDEAENPKEDWVAAGTPDLAAFLLTRFAQISTYVGSEMQYYQHYKSERSIGLNARGRIDILLSRFRPFIGGGYERSRTRPNGEIDVRANLVNQEASGGAAFELSAHAVVFASAVATSVDYRNAFQTDISLDQTLSRDADEYIVGVKTDLTPLASLQVRGSWKEDRFRNDKLRNAKSTNGAAVFTFAPQAIVSGSATIGYQDFVPDDPLIRPYRGLNGSAYLTFTLFELARVNVGFNRGIDYSFDSAEAYYLENTFSAAYTHRIFSRIDLQAKGSHSDFHYGNRATVPAHWDKLDSALGSVGYNLKNKTRLAVNYEFARRRSPEIVIRNYDRRRVFFSWAVAY